MNIEFEPAMIEFQKSSGKVAAKEEDWKVNLSKPFMKDNFDKWKTDMTEAEVLQTEYICREFFERENEHYKRSDYWKERSAVAIQKSLLPLYIKNAKAAVRNLLSNNKNLDQLPPHDRMRARGMLRL